MVNPPDWTDVDRFVPAAACTTVSCRPTVPLGPMTFGFTTRLCASGATVIAHLTPCNVPVWGNAIRLAVIKERSGTYTTGHLFLRGLKAPECLQSCQGKVPFGTGLVFLVVHSFVRRSCLDNRTCVICAKLDACRRVRNRSKYAKTCCRPK